jgi:hypothetical protein
VNEQMPEFVKDYEQSLIIETTIDPASSRLPQRRRCASG